MEAKPIVTKKALLGQYVFKMDSYELIDSNYDGRGVYKITLSLRHSKVPNRLVEEVLNESIGERFSLIKINSVIRTNPFYSEMRGWVSLIDSVISHYFFKIEGEKIAISLCGKLSLKQFSIHDFEPDVQAGHRKCSLCKRLLSPRGINDSVALPKDQWHRLRLKGLAHVTHKEVSM